jgi:ferredoxin/coenzyme F420-reducing hydrogenase delta subunit
MFLTMLALSVVKPALSQGPADLATVPAVVGLDWFYLGFYPLLDSWPGAATWGLAGALPLMLVVLPWLPPLRRAPVAIVDLANCNGCTRCAADCPYNAITMMPRTDGRAFEREARVNPGLCVSCGICAGACPTSMPFRRATELVPGIDLPSLSMATLRDRVNDAAAGLTQAPRIMVFGCDHGVELAAARGPQVAALSLACIGQLPPAFIDYVLSRDLADGVLLTGCADGVCFNRFGIAWTEARLAGKRDPHLRARVPRERLSTLWLGRHRVRELEEALGRFAERLAELQTPRIERRSPVPATVERREMRHG